MQGEDGTLGRIRGAGGRVGRVEMVQHGRAGIREDVHEQARARIGVAVGWCLGLVLLEDGAGGNGGDAGFSQA